MEPADVNRYESMRGEGKMKAAESPGPYRTEYEMESTPARAKLAGNAIR